MEAKVVDKTGKTVACGLQGELYTRGYLVMQGYWGDPEQTSKSIDSEGWMHTGDLAIIDSQGYCKIVGRVKDMLIRGGENVYPLEIEEFLLSHPSIQDVQVFGVPDEKYGEEVCAWVKVSKSNEVSSQDIKSFCEGQISHYKIPRYVKIVKEFPMTITGKPQKYIMRENMIKELGYKKIESSFD